MAVINPTRTFEGSSLEDKSGFGYIRQDVRQLTFGEKSNPEGLYIFFLPAYKVDSVGNGVWFKKVAVRDNFGTSVKRKYYVKNDNEDPATYFERQFKGYWPDDAKAVPATNARGQQIKNYQAYGRITNRVIFNVANYNELQKGSPVDKTLFVLDLPAYNGADLLMKWMQSPGLTGGLNPLVNDPEKAVPVHVKLNIGSGSAPWQINPNAASTFKLPDVYADSVNLYNLDDIYVEKTDEEIISDLRSFYTSEIFDKCMAGSKWVKVHHQGHSSISAEKEDDIPYDNTSTHSGPVVSSNAAVKAITAAPALPTPGTFPAPPPLTAPAVNKLSKNKDELMAFLKTPVN